MIVFYDPMTLETTHLVYAADASYLAAIRAADYPEQWVEIDAYVHHAVLRLSRESGHVVVDDVTDPAAPRRLASTPRLAQLDAGLADQSIVLGATVAWPLPEGARVSVAGQLVDVMDASGTYEFEPATAGRYPVQVQAAGYYDRRFTLEAHPGS